MPHKKVIAYIFSPMITKFNSNEVTYINHSVPYPSSVDKAATNAS